MRRVSNVPLPEANLIGIAAGYALQQVRPWTLPGPRRLRRFVGWPLLAAGTYLVVRSWAEAWRVDLEHPEHLLTSGPYAMSRNPMYVGWALLHLGAGVAGGSAWVVATFPPATLWVHHGVLDEEHALAARFGDEFGRYRSAVSRYLPPVEV